MAMTKEHKEDIAVFLAEAREGTTQVAASTVLSRVRRRGKELHKIYERQCNGHQKPNGDWDEAAATRDELREEALETEIKALGEPFGVTFTTQGDPRGNPVSLLTPKTGRYNTMGGAESGWRL